MLDAAHLAGRVRLLNLTELVLVLAFVCAVWWHQGGVVG